MELTLSCIQYCDEPENTAEVIRRYDAVKNTAIIQRAYNYCFLTGTQISAFMFCGSVSGPGMVR